MEARPPGSGEAKDSSVSGEPIISSISAWRRRFEAARAAARWAEERDDLRVAEPGPRLLKGVAATATLRRGDPLGPSIALSNVRATAGTCRSDQVEERGGRGEHEVRVT